MDLNNFVQTLMDWNNSVCKCFAYAKEIKKKKDVVGLEPTWDYNICIRRSIHLVIFGLVYDVCFAFECG